MLQRLKDAFAFSSEFARWEQLSGLRSILIGNRVAELNGQSASSGQELNVYNLRDIYYNNRKNVINQSKEDGLSSLHATVNFICKIGDLYMAELNLSKPPEPILQSLRFLQLQSTITCLFDERWKQWLEDSESEAKARHDELKSILPIIYAARREASLLIDERQRAICERDIKSELKIVWRSIPTENWRTEREISDHSRLPLSECISWIEALSRNGVVTKIGTALDEPKFRKTPATTLTEAGKNLRNYLDHSFP